MASSGSSGSFADGLLCPVCCEQIKTPKIIPCGHSFCLEPCLRDLLKTSHACPLCRQDIQAPVSGLADDFPTNFALHALVSTTVTSGTEDTSDDSKTECQLHQRQGGYFCGSCLKFLCDECNQTHNDGHEILDLNTISELRLGELEPLMGEIASSRKIIRERMEVVNDAKVTCEKSCQQAESEICDAVSSFTDLIQEEGYRLIADVAKGREAGIKRLNTLEVQLGDVEGTAKRTEELATSLMTRIMKNDIRDTGMFDALTSQQKNMTKELETIRAPPDEMVVVKFQSKSVPSIPLGEVNVFTEAEHLVIEQEGKVNTIASSKKKGCNGFVWFSLNHLLRITLNGPEVFFSPFNGSVETKLSHANIGITATKVSPVLGKDGRSLLFNNSKHVAKLTIDLSTGKSSVCQRSIENAVLYDIAAVCWDAKREGCYVLLHDGITICHFMFGETGKGCEYTRLENKVNSCAIHVNEYGGMAICDNGAVRYYAKVQPQLTRVIPDCDAHGKVSCLTSRGSDRKWFVSCGSRIIQYSDTFQVEAIFHLGYSAVSIHFMDERHFVTTLCDSLIVHSISL